MDEFERHSTYSKEIEDVHEAENILDKVLSTGQNFYNAQKFEAGDFGERMSRGSKRSKTHDGRRSGRSIHSQRAIYELNSRHGVRSNQSATPARSQKSKKSLRDSGTLNVIAKNLLQKSDSNNKLRTIGRKNESSLLNLNQKRPTNAFARNVGRDSIGCELDNLNRMTNAINSKIKRMTIDDAEDTFFKNGALNKLPPIQYPIVSRINCGKITFVAENDAHSKESNFGYSRNKLGGFYNH